MALRFNKDGSMSLTGQNTTLPAHQISSLVLESYLKQFDIFHLPKYIYQIMYEAAPLNNSQEEIERAQRCGKDILLQHITDNHPGYELANFEDFSDKEAKGIHPALDWGLYYKVVKPGVKNYSDMRMIDIFPHQLLEAGHD